MRRIKLAAVALNQTPLDWNGNYNRIVSALQHARKDSASVICLPELCISGYGCEDMFLAPWVSERAWTMLELILPHTQGIVVTVGLPITHRGFVYNGAAVLIDSKIVGIVAKRYLARSGLHYEPRWFTPYPRGNSETLDNGVPVGDIHFRIDDVIVGLEICEDAWVTDRPGRALANYGVDIILSPSASHFAPGKVDIRRNIAVEGSRSCYCAIVSANLLGCESGRIVFDGDTRIVSEGSILSEGRRFSFKDYSIISGTVNIVANRKLRGENAGKSCNTGTRSIEIPVEFTIPEAAIHGSSSETQCEYRYEEMTRAIALGTFDYLRKTHAKGVVISLSGGADSSAVAVLSALSLRLAIRELGFEETCARLPAIGSGLDVGNRTEESLLRSAITCVYQSTKNSSPDTMNSAQFLAESLGLTFYQWDVDFLVSAYTDLIENTIGRKLSWQDDDLTLQNIQPRVRVPGIWMLANLKGALLLSTGNRSEAAVGYSTMDGDTCGGFNPIGSIPKAELIRLLSWLHSCNLDGLGPVCALDLTLSLQPSAELRPIDQAQTDEKDLMPYEVLEKIEEYAIDRKESSSEVSRHTFEFFAGKYSEQLTETFVEKFFSMWHRSQWKRERLAPTLHVSNFNLDPRSGCRFPILSEPIK
jgi:NAD+ synthase (glutamine-hydrolysing)